MSPGPNGKGLSRKHIMWQIKESLKRLQIDYVDIYYAHIFDPETPKRETMSTFNDLVHQGLIRYIGMSNIPSFHLVEYIMISEKLGYEPITVLQYKYNILAREIEEDIIPVAKQFGIGIAAYSPLSQGILTEKYIDFENKKWKIPPLSRGTYQKFDRFFTKENLEKVLKIAELARGEGLTLPQLAIAWVINMGEKVWKIPIIPIVGVSRLEHMVEAVEASEINLTHDVLKVVDEIVKTKQP